MKRESKLTALRRARAHLLLDRIQARAKELGLDKTTQDMWAHSLCEMPISTTLPGGREMVEMVEMARRRVLPTRPLCAWGVRKNTSE